MNHIDFYVDLISPETQQDYRKKLFVIFKKNPCSLSEFSRRIGICLPTVRRFLLHELPVSATSLCKFEKFIRENE